MHFLLFSGVGAHIRIFVMLLNKTTAEAHSSGGTEV